MSFGERMRVPANAEPAAWLTDIVSVAPWTVGGLLPQQFECYLRVAAAPPEVDDWWRAQREIVAAVAGVAARFTDTPDDAWFAIWEGHGFDTAAVQAPRVDLPLRSYYLVAGAVTEVIHLRWAGDPDRWFRPDLWWPADRRWFVATDVDFWSTYVAGSQALCDAITSRLPHLCRPATADEPLPIED